MAATGSPGCGRFCGIYGGEKPRKSRCLKPKNRERPETSMRGRGQLVSEGKKVVGRGDEPSPPLPNQFRHDLFAWRTRPSRGEQHLHRLCARLRLVSLERSTLERNNRRWPRLFLPAKALAGSRYHEAALHDALSRTGRLHEPATRPTAQQLREKQHSVSLQRREHRQLEMRRNLANGKFELRSDAEIFKRLKEFKEISFETIGFTNRK